MFSLRRLRVRLQKEALSGCHALSRCHHPISLVPSARLKFKEGTLEEIKLPEKTRAWELLGKNRRLWTDVIRHDGGINIRERIARGRRRALGKRASEPQA